MGVDKQDDLAFDLAFTEALGGASADEDTVASNTEVTASAQTDEVQEGDAQADAGDPIAPQGAEPGTTTPSSVDGAQQTPPAPNLPDYKAQAEELARQNAALTAQVQEYTTTKAEAPPAQAEQTTPEAEDPEFTAFAAEWPEVAKMMAHREAALMAQVKELTEALIAPVKQELMQSVQPVIQQHQQTAEEKFLNTVKSKHPDVLDLLPEVEAWAETLPTYLKVGVAHALKQGTAEDVIALYDSFKEKTGRTTPAAPSTPSVDEVTRQRLRKMGAVSASRPSSPTAQADANDFEGAFSQAAAEITA